MTDSTPSHLSSDAAAFYDRTRDAYAVSDPHGLELLRLAAEALDTAATARAEIATNGATTFLNRFGTPQTHPAVDAQIRAMGVFCRLVSALGLQPVDSAAGEKG